MIFATSHDQIASHISALEHQIASLQEQLKQTQAQAQAMQSIESAAQSAIAQVQNVLAMANAAATEAEIETFKQALIDQFDTDIAGELPASPDPEPETDPDNDDAIAIDVTHEVDLDDSDDTEPETNADLDLEPETTEQETEAPQLSTVGSQQRSLGDMNMGELRTLANDYGLENEFIRLYGPLTRRTTLIKAIDSYREHNL